MLKKEPREIDALYYPGIFKHQMGMNKQVLEMLRKTVIFAPDFGAVHCSLAIVLGQGDRDRAQAHLRSVLHYASPH